MTSDEMRQHLEMLLADSQARHRDIELLLEASTQQKDRIDSLIRASEIDAENIRLLANIAASHETRLVDHVQRLDDLQKP
jgi:hypothetical protein